MQGQSGGSELNMYDELYAAWRFELENTQLGGLPSNFYTRVTDYLRRIKEKNRTIDKKTLTTTLLENELKRVNCMLHELIWTRYKKLFALVTESQKLPLDLLADEEAKLCTQFLSFTQTYRKFVEDLLQGQNSAAIITKTDKRVVLRFVKEIPAIIGADMKTYGPFMAEDVASVPIENAKILVKQGLAELVEVS